MSIYRKKNNEIYKCSRSVKTLDGKSWSIVPLVLQLDSLLYLFSFWQQRWIIKFWTLVKYCEKKKKEKLLTNRDNLIYILLFPLHLLNISVLKKLCFYAFENN